MAAIFDVNDTSSPVGYEASQTALILMDFHQFIIKMCGDPGAAALAKAKILRDWALTEGIMVVHSLVDLQSTPPPNCRTKDRLAALLSKVASSPEGADEAPEVAYSKPGQEYAVTKRLGVVSGLSSQAAQDLLAEHGIKNLLLCGLSTSNAVLRTAIPATDNGFVVCVIGDACADPDVELQETLLEKVFPRQAHVSSTEEFIAEWKKARNA